jgi:fucose permease
MREISVRSLLISYLAMFTLFCLFVMIGYCVSLMALHAISGSELSELHQGLKSNKLFQDIQFAWALSLSAVAAGWLAARTSNARPIIHGALSCAAFFLLFLCATVYDTFQLSEVDLLQSRPLLKVPQLALPLFGVIGASILLLNRGRSAEMRVQMKV